MLDLVFEENELLAARKYSFKYDKPKLFCHHCSERKETYRCPKCGLNDFEKKCTKLKC